MVLDSESEPDRASRLHLIQEGSTPAATMPHFTVLPVSNACAINASPHWLRHTPTAQQRVEGMPAGPGRVTELSREPLA